MSIPTDVLRYAGVWDVASTYKYAMFVISPIDNGSYVWVNSLPVTGGADPSIVLGDWVLIPPIATGDITGITAGTGLSGGGSAGVVTITNTGVITAEVTTGLVNTGTDTDLVIENTGVLSLDGAVGVLTNKCGQWYKTSKQTVNTGDPTTTTVTFDESTSWSDTSILKYDSGNALWECNQNGIYHLQAQISYGGFTGGTVFTDPTHLININIGRGLVTDSPIRSAFQWDTASTNDPDNNAVGIYELQVGDKIQVQIVDDLTAGSFVILPQFAAPNDFDYNSFFTWSLIKTLP